MSRRIRRPTIEIFTLSFLDIISCAFGAIVMLVLLAKNGDVSVERSSDELRQLIAQVLESQQTLENLNALLANKQTQLDLAEQVNAGASEQSKQLDASIPRAQQTIRELEDKAKSLREEIRQQNARLATPSKVDKPDDEVGGIPTDADYVVFVIDNSGSMSLGRRWNQVIDVVEDILKSHPEMKGFQVVAADGTFLYQGQEGHWLPDGASFRKKALDRLQGFTGGASAPEVGINRVLDLYQRESGKVSLYVFGDDYRPSNLDQIVSEITNTNTDASGKPRFRIHGIGFYRPNQGNAEQFAAFMQAVAKRNRGAFVGLSF